MSKVNKLPIDGFFIVIVYFKEYKDNTANDTRRSLKSMVNHIRKRKKQSVEVVDHIFALMKSLDLKYLYSLLALLNKLDDDKDYLVGHHLSAVIKNPPGGKKASRAIGAIEMIRYKCDNIEQVKELYEEIKRWCDKRGWTYEVMFADWIIE